MISSREIVWLAGLLEGEGCFRFHKSPEICLSMADKDVVIRVSAIFQTSIRIDHGLRKTPLHRTYVNGTRAAAVMMSIYSEMGQRRQKKIKQILESWKMAKKRGRPPILK